MAIIFRALQFYFSAKIIEQKFFILRIVKIGIYDIERIYRPIINKVTEFKIRYPMST